MSAANRGGKPGRDKSGKNTHSLQNGKTDTSITGVKHQPTAEQLRIAQITSDKADVEPEVAKKVTQVCELTGRTSDEALAVLHDCDYDVHQAVEILLEKQGDQVNDWQEIGKKKKTPVGGKAAQLAVTSGGSGESANDGVTDRNDAVTDSDRILDRHSESAPRGRRERGGPPRFSRGRGSASANGEKGGSTSRERPSFEQGGGSGGRRRGGYSNSGGGVGRGGYGRGYYGGRNNFDAGTPHIDTWSNDKTPNGTGDTGGNNPEQEWSTEDWTADEWSGSLEESRVFTASASGGGGGGHTNAVFGSDSTTSAAVASSVASSSSFFDPSSLSSQVYVASSVSSSSLRAPGSGTTANADSVVSSLLGEATIYRSNTLQSASISQDSMASGNYDLNLLLQQSKLNDQYSMPGQQPKLTEAYSQEQSAAYLSRYTQEATEVIKNAVGIGSSNMPSRPAVGMDPIGHNLTTSQSVMQSCVTAPVAKQPQQQRPKIPPPSKIPASAVEMPASMNSAQLDVQFGNWDIPSVAASVSSASDAATLSFTADLGASSHYGGAQHSMSQVSGAPLHGGSGLAPNYDISVSRSAATASSSVTESSKASLLALDDLGVGGGAKQPAQTAVSTGSYPNSGSTAKDFVNAKMVASQQPTPAGFPSSQGGDRKSSPYVPSQPVQQSMSATNPASSLTSLPSQMPFSQVTSSYSVGIDSAALPSSYKSSVATTSSSPTTVFSSQQHSANQYGSASSFSGYPSNATDASSASSLAAVVAAAQQQYSSYTGTAAPGFGPQPMVAGTGGNAYGPSQSQAAAYAASSGLHGAGNKSYNSISSAITDKQPTTVPTYSSGSLSSQAYDAANSYQFPSGQLPSGGGSGYPLSSGQYQSGGQLSYQNVTYNQSSVATAYDSTGNTPAYGSAAHSYQSNMYQRQARDSASSSAGNYQNAPDATVAAAGYQRSISGLNQPVNSGMVQQTTTAPAVPAPSTGKLADSLGKLSVKDGQGVASSVPVTVPYDAASASSASSAATSTTSSASVGLLTSTTSAAVTSRATTAAAASTKSTAPSSSKAVINMPVGGPAMMNNYMIAQPPGFQLAAFSYPTQQPLQYAYEDLQLLQSGQRFPVPYYDVPFQPATTMTGRDNSAALNAPTYAAGADATKLPTIDPMSPVAVQPTPAPAQQATVPGSSAAVAVQQQQQQSYLNPAAIHPAPAGYSYYYPGTAGIMPVGSYYTPMIQMGGLVPLANPAHGVTTATTQYQKAATAAMYGSHTGYNVGGQTQDFSKSFGATQSSSKGPAVAAGASAAASDVITGGSGFGKNHVQTFDKSGFHSGTPPPPFNMAAAQTGAALGGGYGAPYMPTMIPHQSHSTQILHHPMSQEASIAGRSAVPQNQTQQPKSGSMNKAAGYSTAYWGTN